MLAGFKTNITPLSPSGSIVDGKLILSLPQAITPVVWQIDLSETQSSAFEVIGNTDGSFSLVSRRSGTKNVDIIAPFHDRETAIAALMVTARALENGQNKIQPDNQTRSIAQIMPSSDQFFQRSHPEKQSRGGVGWLTWIFAAIGVIMLVFLISTMIMMQPSRIAMETGDNSGAGQSTNSATTSDETGVPVSADDFLRQQ
jgi:hypothetical protein